MAKVASETKWETEKTNLIAELDADRAAYAAAHTAEVAELRRAHAKETKELRDALAAAKAEADDAKAAGCFRVPPTLGPRPARVPLGNLAGRLVSKTG